MKLYIYLLYIKSGNLIMKSIAILYYSLFNKEREANNLYNLYYKIFIL